MALSPTEISSLRSELVGHSDHAIELAKFVVIAASALIGFALASGGKTGGFISLVPLLVLVPTVSLAMNRRFSVVRIATYLRAFAGDEFRYEARLWELRQRHGFPWVGFQLSVLSSLS